MKHITYTVTHVNYCILFLDNLFSVLQQFVHYLWT